MRVYKYRGKVVGLTLFTTLLLVVLTVLGVARAYWSGSVSVKMDIKIGTWGSRIVKWRVLRYSRPPQHLFSPEADSLEVYCSNLTGRWYMWIAVLIENNGTVPITLYEPTMRVLMTNGSSKLVTIKAYLYHLPIHLDIWNGDVSKLKLPLKGYFKNICIDPGKKALMLINIVFSSDSDIFIKDMFIIIKLNYRPGT